MDEFTDNPEASEAAPDQSYDDAGYDDAGYAAEPDYEPGYEAQPASPPDLSDALAQLNERQEHQLYGDDDQDQGYDPDLDPYDPEEGYEEEGLSPEEQAINEIVDERVSQAVEPIFEQQREAEIIELAERYPALRQPEVLEAVDGELRAIAEAYGDESIIQDARMAETVLLAHAAREQLENAQAQGPQPQQGAVLETGAGPGGPPRSPMPLSLPTRRRSPDPT